MQFEGFMSCSILVLITPFPKECSWRQDIWFWILSLIHRAVEWHTIISGAFVYIIGNIAFSQCSTIGYRQFVFIKRGLGQASKSDKFVKENKGLTPVLGITMLTVARSYFSQATGYNVFSFLFFYHLVSVFYHCKILEWKRVASDFRTVWVDQW